LEEYGNQLKTRYDRAESAADQLLRKATTAYEELAKYSYIVTMHVFDAFPFDLILIF
jgi:hypothetical protein